MLAVCDVTYHNMLVTNRWYNCTRCVDLSHTPTTACWPTNWPSNEGIQYMELQRSVTSLVSCWREIHFPARSVNYVFCLFWDRLFIFSSSSSFVFFGSYYVSLSLLAEFSASHYQPRTNPPSVCSSWHIIHVISNYLWARLIPSAGWVWELSSMALYKSQSTSVWISLSQSYHRFASSRRKFQESR